MEIRRMEVSGSSAARAVGKVGILLADSANPFWRNKVEEYLRQAPDWGFEIVFREGREHRYPHRPPLEFFRNPDEKSLQDARRLTQ